MENPEEINGVLVVCGIIMFLSGWMIIKVLKALDEDDQRWNGD